MNKYVKKFNLLIIPAAVLLLNFNFVSAGLLNTETASDIKSQAQGFSAFAGFDDSTTIGGVIALVVQAFLGLLGIIFLILIITAGYNWMTAGGEEEKIRKAKDMIQRAIIGLIIIIAAYAITYFVFKNLGGVAGSGFQE
ncbi:hypothetical protein KJ586_02350 [Patescibacteria group bacterium]|nr:hypothetical protein [Patescibacteria group bacterium]MBU4347782.1 hypothetical protein [Patescibacteria group bacterium]MBU4455329.1 hypothetical protein [Patescibacteria group bacterium]MCG2690962.1 hypothetical protein [Candidatus Parcubacteria bacterium]